MQALRSIIWTLSDPLNIRRHHVAAAILVLVVLVVVALTLTARDHPVQSAGPWSSVSAGARLTCALDRQGHAACWGNAGGAVPAGLRLTGVVVGGGHACGLTPTGTVSCWGTGFEGSTRAPSGTFVKLAAGWDYTCGIREDGSVACWGWNKDGQTRAPSGAFTSLSAGYHHTCGIRRDRSAACWGANYARQSEPPSGPFTQVVASKCHSCGLRPGGSVACWGCNPGHVDPGGGARKAGRNTPPEGKFQQLSAGYLHTCGLTTDGLIRCWGHNAVGQATPPPGKFIQVDAGFFHTCGVVTADGSLRCWGWREPVLAVPGQEAVMARARQRPPLSGAPLPGLTDHTCPYEGLGLLYLQQGRKGLASSSLAEAVTINTNSQYKKLMTMARRLIDEGKRKEAEVMLRKARAIMNTKSVLAPPTSSRCSAVAPDCPSGHLCDVFSGLCTVQPAHCDGGAECPGGSVCYSNHRRCYPVCSPTMTCAAGRVCDRRTRACLPLGPPCMLQEHCTKPGEVCLIQGCLATCTARSPQCPGEGRCVLPPGVCQ